MVPSQSHHQSTLCRVCRWRLACSLDTEHSSSPPPSPPAFRLFRCNRRCTRALRSEREWEGGEGEGRVSVQRSPVKHSPSPETGQNALAEARTRGHVKVLRPQNTRAHAHTQRNTFRSLSRARRNLRKVPCTTMWPSTSNSSSRHEAHCSHRVPRHVLH